MLIDHTSLMSVGADLACAPTQEWSLGEMVDPAYPWNETCAWDALEQWLPSHLAHPPSADELVCLASA